MTIFRITRPDRNLRTGEMNFLNFECGYPDVDHLIADLNDGKIVSGKAIYTKRVDEGGALLITGRKAIGVGRALVAAVEIPTMRFVEREGGE